MTDKFSGGVAWAVLLHKHISGARGGLNTDELRLEAANNGNSTGRPKRGGSMLLATAICYLIGSAAVLRVRFGTFIGRCPLWWFCCY